MSIILKKPAIFLDRDGVLTEEKSYITSLEMLSIFPYTVNCIKKIHEKGYYAFVITNQSGVARGFLTEEVLCKINEYLIQHIGVDMVYYCPHHEDGIIEKYSIKCNCRKPQIGLIEKACQEYAIDLEKSFMVGDRADDIITGQKAGIKTVLLESGYGTAKLEKEVTPDYILNDLRDFIELL